MTFAIFYDGKFVNFWLNSPDDTGWIERTIQAMKWDHGKVEVVTYNLSRYPGMKVSVREEDRAVLVIDDMAGCDPRITEFFPTPYWPSGAET